jgi:hypothetical protein
VPVLDFDTLGLFEELDAQRSERGLSWRGVADEIWELSSVLNARRRDHPISPSTLTNMGKRRAISCQHALFMLRWLDRSPESFLKDAPPDLPATALPTAGADRRLRWNLKRLHAGLDLARREQQMTWPQVARVLRCTPNQLTGLRTARFATSMDIAMRIAQWLGRPAADFIDVTQW